MSKQSEQLALDLTGGKTIFCRACLEDRPAAKAGPDPRYCQFCYDFLIAEAKNLPAGKRPRWIPKNGSTASNGVSTRRSVAQKSIPIHGDRGIEK